MVVLAEYNSTTVQQYNSLRRLALFTPTIQTQISDKLRFEQGR